MAESMDKDDAGYVMYQEKIRAALKHQSNVEANKKLHDNRRSKLGRQ